MIFHWTLIFSILVSSGLPMPSRPRTKRLSRGPVWSDALEKLVVTPQALNDAERLRKQRRRIAVVAGLDAAGQAVDSAQVAAELIRSGMRYGDQLIVVHEWTSRPLFETASSGEQIRKIANENAIDLVVVVRVEATQQELSLQVFSTSKETLPQVPLIKIADMTEAVVDAALQSRGTLLEAINALPNINRDQLNRRPVASFEAMEHLADAKRMLGSAFKVKNDNQRQSIFKNAAKAADQAIRMSPNFLEAYIVKASCEDELGAKEDVKMTLRTAFQKMNPGQDDLLTRLELRGDFERFARTNRLNALEAYQELLDTDPTNLTGLWAMIDILLTGDGTTPVPDQDIKDAADLAAKLVTFHPQCGVAQQILKQEQ